MCADREGDRGAAEIEADRGWIHDFNRFDFLDIVADLGAEGGIEDPFIIPLDIFCSQLAPVVEFYTRAEFERVGQKVVRCFPRFGEGGDQLHVGVKLRQPIIKPDIIQPLVRKG